MIRPAVRRHRINRVVNFIHAHLHESIDLDRLADIACLSKYQFARTFASAWGESLIRCLWRIRLEHGARQLLFEPDLPVGTVAAQSGFDSHRSFTRAFARRFGMPPQAIRQLPFLPSRLNGTGDLPIAPPPANIERTPVRIEERPALRLAYVRHVGSYLRDGIPIRRAAASLRAWATAHGVAGPESAVICISHDNRRITPDRFCRFDVALPVAPDVTEDDVVSIETIPPGRYAAASVACRNDQMLAIWEWLSLRWRPTNKASYTQRWSYEIAAPTADGTIDPQRGVEICLRVSA